MQGQLEHVEAIREALGVTKTLLIGHEVGPLREATLVLGGDLLLASSHPDAALRLLQNEVMDVGIRMGGGINGLRALRDLLLRAYVEGRIASDERLLVVDLGDDAGSAVLFFDMDHDDSVGKLKKDLEFRADVGVVEAVLHVATELAKEGREHRPVGALFIVGDTDRVMKQSRQVVLNPYHGHEARLRNVLDPESHETIKEFAQIDGAIVVRDDGIVEAAGRYIDVNDPTDLPSGLGGRHLACAAATTDTKAIGITVSETGVVRIFKDGKILLRVGVT